MGAREIAQIDGRAVAQQPQLAQRRLLADGQAGRRHVEDAAAHEIAAKILAGSVGRST